jgi:predicted transcriptional regulator
MVRKLPLQIRIDPRLEARLKKLARKNRRSVTSEVNNIVECYLSIHCKPE